jgi:hypothetical protein
LAISGLIRRRPDILPSEVQVAMGVANTCERPGERYSQQFLAKEGFV